MEVYLHPSEHFHVCAVASYVHGSHTRSQRGLFRRAGKQKGYGQYLSNILLGNSLINTSMKQNTASAKISMKSRPKNPVTTVVRNFWRESISLYVFARLMSCWLLILEIKLLSDLNYCVNPLASSFIP